MESRSGALGEISRGMGPSRLTTGPTLDGRLACLAGIREGGLECPPRLSVRIVIPGKPAPKQGGQQATVTTSDGRVISMRYQPAKVRNYAAFVAMCAREAMAGELPFSGPIRRVLTLTISTPKSWSKKRRARHNWATVRPDVGNVAKTIDDALQGICYADDKQIVEAEEVKRYGEADGVEIMVQALGD